MAFVFNNLPLGYQRTFEENVIYYKLKTFNSYNNQQEYLRHFYLGYHGGPGM
jgi:hypothetical protein